jgi:hypothetical protein
MDQAALFVEDEGVVVGSIVAIEDRRVVGSERPPGRSELGQHSYGICCIKYTTLALHLQATPHRQIPPNARPDRKSDKTLNKPGGTSVPPVSCAWANSWVGKQLESIEGV